MSSSFLFPFIRKWFPLFILLLLGTNQKLRAQSGAVLNFTMQQVGQDYTYLYVDLFMQAGANYVSNDTDYGTTNSMGSWNGCNLRFTASGVAATLAIAADILYTPVGNGFSSGPVTLVSSGGCYSSETCFNVALSRDAPAVDAGATPVKIGQFRFKKSVFPDGTAILIRNTTVQTCAIRESFWSNPANVFSGRSEVVSGASVVLPVTLSGWKATAACRSVFMTWSVLNELNFQCFDLERSDDGKQFSFLTSISGKSSSPDYKYVDIVPTSGIHYYRLKLVDRDGKYGYSNILTVSTNRCPDDGTRLLAYPNPNRSGTSYNIRFESLEPGLAKLRIVNSSGMTVHVEDVYLSRGSNYFPMSGSHLPAGVYRIELYFNNDLFSTTMINI